MEEDPPIIGIDLGTTYSSASVYLNGEIKIIPNEIGEKSSPSYVSFFNCNEKLIGTFAKERIIKDQKIIYNSKRLIGRRFTDREIQEDIQALPFKILEDVNKDKVKIKIEGLENLTKNEYYPEEISAMILKKIKNDAEFYLKKKINEVVITTPAYFNQKQKMATKQAAQIAGLKVRSFINEPTAASIAYAFYNNNLGEKNLIFDFGGGTLDLTLLDYSYDKKIYCKILCSLGNTHLGGQDIDKIIYDLVRAKYENRIISLENNNYDYSFGKLRLLKACEKAKIALSTKEEAFIFVDSFIPKLDIEYCITRERLEEKIKDFFKNKIEECFRNLLSKAKINKNEIKSIILVGGSSKIPILKTLIRDFFQNPNLKFLSSIDPEDAVSLGAGLIAGQIYGEKSLQYLELYDVTSLSLGTNVKDGKMNIIIPKNSQIPISNKKIYTTIVDNQDTISNKVYEGESEYYKDNYLLGDFKIKNLTKRKAGLTKIELEFCITSNLFIKVRAKELGRNDQSINETKDVVKLEEPKGFFSSNEIKTMRKFIDSIDKNDWQLLLEGRYQENMIKLKNDLFQSQNKYSIQYTIVQTINEFLCKFKEVKSNNINYNIYSLYLIFFFYEINNLLNLKENINIKEIIQLKDDFKIENKLEIIKSELKDIIWEILDIFNTNILFYNYLKLIVIELLLQNVQYKICLLNFSVDFVGLNQEKLNEYKTIIKDITLTLEEYRLKLDKIRIDNIDVEKNNVLNMIKLYNNNLEIKEFIVDFYLLLNNIGNEVFNNPATKNKCNRYLSNFYDYNLEIDSAEFLKLKEMSYNFEINDTNNPAPNPNYENSRNYIQMFREMVNGKYHGKQDYIGAIDRNDSSDEDENEKAYKNLDRSEAEIIDIIDRAKNQVNETLKHLHLKRKKDLFYIVKYCPKEHADFKKLEKLYYNEQYEEMIDYIKSLYNNIKRIRTIKDFETKIKDDCIMTKINNFLLNN